MRVAVVFRVLGGSFCLNRMFLFRLGGERFLEAGKGLVFEEFIMILCKRKLVLDNCII